MKTYRFKGDSMKNIMGMYGDALIFTDIVDQATIDQVKILCDQEFVAGSKIRVMPDCHYGAGCTVGLTMTITDKVCPNLVGVDIGCGVRAIHIGRRDVDFAELDNIIKTKIPYGRNVHPCRIQEFDLTDLRCYRELRNVGRLEHSIGTLGGGNHFIEVDTANNGSKYITIHSGSRNLGHQVATIYQNLAYDLCCGKDEMCREKDWIIKNYREQGRKSEIPGALKALEAKYKDGKPSIPKDLCYLWGKHKDNYLHDMEICQRFAVENREAMARIILDELHMEGSHAFEVIHNYIDFRDNILRKGAISAYKHENILIPINMRDGCIIGKGKGNAAWNYSAPHGAGRIMGRKQAKKQLQMDEFRRVMAGVYTTTVSGDTLDEAPMAYKSIDAILENIAGTVDVEEIIKPVYNFKASE